MSMFQRCASVEINLFVVADWIRLKKCSYYLQLFGSVIERFCFQNLPMLDKFKSGLYEFYVIVDRGRHSLA